MEKVKIIKLDHFGRGIASINNKLCFINGALPDEECNIEIILDKKNYSLGKVVSILKKSEDRIDVPCPYYEYCGGCHIMHYNYLKQLEYKELKVKEIIERFSGLSNIKINKIINGSCFNYRNKITLHGSSNKIGLFKEKTNTLIQIDNCLITSEKINNIVKELSNYFNNTNDKINSITIKTTSLDEIMISIDGSIDKSNFIKTFFNINSIYLNGNLIHGKESITEVINDLFFEVYPLSFFQVNYKMMLEMYGIIINYYKENKNLNVLDLYCGTGTIGMLISRYCNSVVGVEVNNDAVISANKCKEKNKINNIKFYLGKVEDKIDEFKNIDSIVVDPPRSGLDKHTIDTILNIYPESIIYVSCDPVTLARDLKILKEKYIIKEITPIDMFPNTYHVESVSLLCRKET